jgi:outer membrane protein
VNAANALQNAKLYLSRLLNIPYSPNIAVEPLSAEVALQASAVTAVQVYNDALATLAIVKAADLRTESAKADIRIRKANYFPSISLQGGVNSNYSSTASKDIFINTSEVESPNFVEVNGTRYPVKVQQQNFRSEKIGFTDQFKNNRYSYFSVGLSIPILNNFRTRNNVAVGKLNKKAAEVEAESVRTQLQQLTEQSYYNMNFSKDSYLALAEQVKALEESFRTAEVKFNTGAINSVDYLIAKNSLDNARLDLIRSRYDFILRKQIVEYYRGNRSF